jgi:hypothetical protein
LVGAAERVRPQLYRALLGQITVLANIAVALEAPIPASGRSEVSPPYGDGIT